MLRVASVITTTPAMTTRPIRRNPSMVGSWEGARKTWKLRIASPGRRETMPAKMMSDTPLPMPNSVISSPIHISARVPAVTAANIVSHSMPVSACKICAPPPETLPQGPDVRSRNGDGREPARHRQQCEDEKNFVAQIRQTPDLEEFTPHLGFFPRLFPPLLWRRRKVLFFEKYRLYSAPPCPRPSPGRRDREPIPFAAKVSG